MKAPSMFDSFNASQTQLKELCDTFIVNDYYNVLSKPNHVIMVGPRGSGKTTLLRMLQVDALDSWVGEHSEKYRKNVNFSGVFVPTDRFWKDRFDEIRMQTSLASQEGLIDILQSIFIYHVLGRIISVLRFKTDRNAKESERYGFVDLSKSDELELVTLLANNWHLTPSVFSLRNLAAELISKTEKLSNFLDSLIQKKTSIKKAPEYLTGDMFSIVKSAIKTINLFMDDDNKTWAILFDELELAPNKVVESLIKAMRGSGTEEVILKLAVSPYHEELDFVNTPSGPMPNQDYTLLNLTGSEKEGMNFAINLCKQKFKNAGYEKPLESYFDEPPSIDRESTQEIFLELSKKDASFSEYLKKRKIEIDKIVEYGEDKSPYIRKIKFVCALRNYYLKENLQKRGLRRPADYYAGFKHICKALEYNPRMLIGIMSNFLSIVSTQGKISIPAQLNELGNYYDSFRSLLETIAITSIDGRYRNVYDLIRVVGEYFEGEMLGEQFKEEPKGSVRLDKKSEIFPIIGLALNAGAMVRIKDKDTKGFGEISGTKCRLSYLFSQEFKLTLTEQKDIDISKIVPTVIKKADLTVSAKAIDQLEIKYDNT